MTPSQLIAQKIGLPPATAATFSPETDVGDLGMIEDYLLSKGYGIFQNAAIPGVYTCVCAGAMAEECTRSKALVACALAVLQ